MHTAFLFDSDSPELGGWYGYAVMMHILDTGVLQVANRPMRVSVGDILTFLEVKRSGGSTSDLQRLNSMVYKPNVLDLLFRTRLARVLGEGTVYCWLFQNITLDLSSKLHERLRLLPFYLGSMDVDFSYEPQLNFFRNLLVEKYRFSGCKVSEFFNMGEQQEPELEIKEAFEKHSFIVDYEDIGARRSIFDNYDKVSHFRRVASFQEVFSNVDGLTVDDASSITFSLEELHPQLFDVFSAAARSFSVAETTEDVAQAAFSGRRILEKLANYLYPPQKGLRNGRKIDIPQYGNRLWAYIEETILNIGLSEENIKIRLGAEVERLIKLFNEGLHDDPTKDKLEAAFRDLVIWIAELIELSPVHARKPYLAYQREIRTYSEELQDLYGQM